MKCVEGCFYSALEKVATEMTVDEVVKEVKKDEFFYGDQGGVTISGGEPMFFAEKTIRLIDKIKKEKISVILETSGYFDEKFLSAIFNKVDLVLWDVKDTDDERHKKYTGVSNQKILNNLFKFDTLGGKTIMRCIMVKGVNTDEKHLNNIVDIYLRLKNVLGIEIFSYHHFSESKYKNLGFVYAGKREWATNRSEMQEIKEYLLLKGCKNVTITQ
ncbi:MAG: glycyl-radical enzyme activating protein [Clostridia bacterium]|nr:glycyl-radical enzyme activating protein [Clostridia bacterium]